MGPRRRIEFLSRPRACLAAAFAALPMLVSAAAFALAASEDPAALTIKLADGRIQLQAPPNWEARKPQTRIVEYEFAVAPVEGDQESARVTVMGAGGGVEANIQRWIDQFEQADGSSTKEKSKVEQKEIAGAQVHMVTITGTYKDRPGGGPFTRTAIVPRPNYRMLGAVIVTPNRGHYFVKLYGPDKTVAAQDEAFRAMLGTLKVE